jgi:hypothetical protein
MKLADLLAETSQEDLERLAHEHARADEQMPRALLQSTIEGVLRSHRFLQQFLMNRHPPTFAALMLLLDADSLSLPASSFKQVVMDETQRICGLMDSREILARDDQLRVYRKVLYQARSNDRLIDESEASILSVLRQELDITHVEHFLIEHHADLREFWSQGEAFLRELNALRSAGIVFFREGMMLLPEDLARVLRQVLGFDMSREGAKRLFAKLTNPELHEALTAIQAPTKGGKDERIERLIAHMAQARFVLRLKCFGLERLRELCREIGATIGGVKDDLVERIVAHVASGRDILREPEPEPPVQEPRKLDERRFVALFSRLRGHELGAVLAEFELRRWGSKETQTKELWEAHRSEETLLNALTSSDLEGLLKRLEIKAAGSKAERIQRAIEHFAKMTDEELVPTDDIAQSVVADAPV